MCFTKKSMFCVLAAVLVFPASSRLAAQVTDPPPAPNAEEIPVNPPQFPVALGISVTDSPGDGVLVQGVAWGSPARRAGIRPGDFVIAVADKTIENPIDLREQLQGLPSGKSVDVQIWRRGELLTKSVDYDPRFSDAVRGKAWLGVMLQTSRGGDVLIADVLPASPAESGGIRVGDTVLRLNAEHIDSADELVQLMRKVRAGEDVEVTVLRNGEERTFTIQVGSAVQRTMRWFQQQNPLQRLEREWYDRVPQFKTDEATNALKNVIERLRREMDELRNEVQQLRDGQPTPKENSQPDGSNATEKEISVESIDASQRTTFLANIDAPRCDYTVYRRGRYWYPYRYPIRYARPYRAYYAPAYRYRHGVYPRTPNMLYFGPEVRVYYNPYYGPWIFR